MSLMFTHVFCFLGESKTNCKIRPALNVVHIARNVLFLNGVFLYLVPNNYLV